MFSFFKRRRIGGEIAFYGLQDWWLNSFTPQEHAYIVRKFQPFGIGSSNSLITGSISWNSQSVISFLQNLSSWFNNPQDRHISIRILRKAEQLSEQNPTTLSSRDSHKNDIPAKLSKQEANNIIDKHFLHHEEIKTYYRERNSNPIALKKTIAACQNQIALAPLTAKAFRKKWRGEPLPSHPGYKQLAIILEKQKRFQEALTLCNEALRAKWDGDWEKRIKRLDKKNQNKNILTP